MCAVMPPNYFNYFSLLICLCNLVGLALNASQHVIFQGNTTLANLRNKMALLSLNKKDLFQYKIALSLIYTLPLKYTVFYLYCTENHLIFNILKHFQVERKILFMQ